MWHVKQARLCTSAFKACISMSLGSASCSGCQATHQKDLQVSQCRLKTLPGVRDHHSCLSKNIFLQKISLLLVCILIVPSLAHSTANV